jgi:hypothetical protein
MQFTNCLTAVFFSFIMLAVTASCERRVGMEDRPEGTVNIGWARDEAVMKQDDWRRIRGYLTVTPHAHQWSPYQLDYMGKR